MLYRTTYTLPRNAKAAAGSIDVCQTLPASMNASMLTATKLLKLHGNCLMSLSNEFLFGNSRKKYIHQIHHRVMKFVF